MRALLFVAVLALTALAGCSGQVDVQQTEPLRIQLEESKQVAVSEADPEPKKVLVETCPEDQCTIQQVEVEVTVTQVAVDGPSRVLVIVETEEGERLAEREVVVGGNATSNTTSSSATNTTSGTSTTSSSSSTSTSGTTGPVEGDDTVVIQNFFIDVHGKDNLIVLTQAIEGEADVQVAAYDSSATQASNTTSSDPASTTSPDPTNTTSSSSPP